MAATETFVTGQLYDMPLADLQPDPNQPRKYLDPVALDEITASVKEQKVLSPIIFRVENGICYIVAGERRCIAARRAGFTTIPALFTDSPNHEAISLIENTIRADLTPIEEAEALDRLQKSLNCTQEELGRIVARTPASVSQTLSLTRLPQAIRDECRKDTTVPKRVLIGIAARKQERGMLKAYEIYKASVNPEKKEKTGSDVTKVQGAVKALEAARKRVEALEAGELYVEEKEALTATLTSMKGAIETLLAAIAEPGTDEETPTDGPVLRSARPKAVAKPKAAAKPKTAAKKTAAKPKTAAKKKESPPAAKRKSR